MDGTAAIHSNLIALKRILAGIVAMAGLSGMAAKGAIEMTLPRHLRLAILRLLRPAESVARRLIIAAARGLVAALPPLRETTPKPVDPSPFLRRFGIAVVLSPEDIARMRASTAHPEAQAKGLRRTATLPLFDPPRRLRRQNSRAVPPHAAPRILSPGLAVPYRLPPPPSRDDPVDCTRLGLRLAALTAALDDLPAQARRFARWQARRSRVAAGRLPLRPGRPPGGRLSRFDPTAFRRRNIRDIDEVLAHAHALALYALQYPDTS